MTQIQEPQIVAQIISTLLNEISKQRITDASMLPIILGSDEKQADNLRIIDGLYQSVLTSLQFGQHRRAVWYLQAFSLMCDKTFEGSNKDHVIQALQRRIQT